MRTILLTILIAAALAATAFAQAGPGKEGPKKKPKPDTTKVATAKPKKDEPSKARPDTTEAEKEKKPADSPKEKPRNQKPTPPFKPKPAQQEPAPKGTTAKAQPRKEVQAQKPTARPAAKSAPKPAEKPADKKPGPAAPISQKATLRPHPSSPVKRAILCERIVNREPVGAISGVTTPLDTLYFFTEIVGLAGATITHKWKHGEEMRAEVPMTIGGPYWRVYSRKVIRADWTGAWTVEVIDSVGNVLALQPFVYEPDSTAQVE